MPDPASRAVSYGLLLVLTLLSAVWGAFLVPLRVGGTPVPLGLLLALAPVPLCLAGGRLLQRRAAAAVPGGLWVATALALGSQRREGDLVVTGGALGIAFLAVGALAAAAAVGGWRPAQVTEEGDALAPSSSRE